MLWIVKIFAHVINQKTVCVCWIEACSAFPFQLFSQSFNGASITDWVSLMPNGKRRITTAIDWIFNSGPVCMWTFYPFAINGVVFALRRTFNMKWLRQMRISKWDLKQAFIFSNVHASMLHDGHSFLFASFLLFIQIRCLWNIYTEWWNTWKLMPIWNENLRANKKKENRMTQKKKEKKSFFFFFFATNARFRRPKNPFQFDWKQNREEKVGQSESVVIFQSKWTY